MPKMADGTPNLQGIWAATTFAPAYDIEDHPVAQFGIPAGKGVIVDPPGGKIPYQPWAAAKRKDLIEHHMYEDPEAHCTLSGVPRQMYAPFGFQIFQPAGYAVMFFEAFHAYRIIPMDGRPHAPAAIKTFEGDSRGHWEGNTLVVDVTNQNGDTWFDMAGNFHSDAIHVVERYTPVDVNTIQYQARIEDPNVYTKPWTIAFTIGRNVQPHYELMEYACVEGEQDLKHYVEGEGGKAQGK
ncbi:MAG TPA: hypothetical protein VFW83_01185 [Bryobacteraceae bacterium]|nr:hypothetical protein [Bryobacteraceae bacterium]